MMRSLFAVAAAALLLAGCSSEPSAAADICPSPVEGSRIEMGEFFYDPECDAIAAEGSLEIVNTGGVPHTFTVKETDIDVNVPAGESTSVDLTGIEPGTYEVMCTLHPQMTGGLQVR